MGWSWYWRKNPLSEGESGVIVLELVQEDGRGGEITKTVLERTMSYEDLTTMPTFGRIISLWRGFISTINPVSIVEFKISIDTRSPTRGFIENSVKRSKEVNILQDIHN